jgi:hypothetical protein
MVEKSGFEGKVDGPVRAPSEDAPNRVAAYGPELSGEEIDFRSNRLGLDLLQSSRVLRDGLHRVVGISIRLALSRDFLLRLNGHLVDSLGLWLSGIYAHVYSFLYI